MDADNAKRAELKLFELQDAKRRASPRANVVHEAIRREGEDELGRSVSALAWSGFAAGLSMGFSLIGEALIRSHLPDYSWRPLLAKFGYTLGFLIVILGRQQLFTENTLTVILPLLMRKDSSTLKLVLRLWSVVLAANLAGAALFAWGVSGTPAFGSEDATAIPFISAGIQA
jgi:formate-nitrite transporter family protein